MKLFLFTNTPPVKKTLVPQSYKSYIEPAYNIKFHQVKEKGKKLFTFDVHTIKYANQIIINQTKYHFSEYIGYFHFQPLL